MPFRDGNVLHMVTEVIPQGLHSFKLIGKAHFVEFQSYAHD
jgi:hypothetical protein